MIFMNEQSSLPPLVPRRVESPLRIDPLWLSSESCTLTFAQAALSRRFGGAVVNIVKFTFV